MRMPRPRHNHSLPRWVKRTWKLLKRERKIEDFSNPPDMPVGTKIYDALEFAKPPPERIVFPEPYARNTCYMKNDRNPDWNARIHHYTPDIKIIEGYKQSLVLFKTIQYKGLCKPVEALLGQVALTDADQLLKRKVISEYFLDCTQEVLPKRIHPERPWIRLFRDYGVPLKRKVTGLENQFYHLCASAVGPAACQRHKLLSPYAKVVFQREGETVLSEVVSDAVVLASQPLPVMDANPATTETQSLEDIYPLSPLLDLGAINIYKPDNISCVGGRSPNRFGHMLFLGDRYLEKWLDKQILARAIAACFTFSASQAITLFGTAVKKLPSPVCLNCISFQEKKITFLSYQLNTLDLDSTDGVKNQVWIDGPHQLFEDYTEESGLTNYEPSVLSKALALTSHGLNL